MPYTKWTRVNDFIEVSEAGEVKSHGKVIKGETCKNGYKRVNTSHKGKVHKFLVHRLVAEAFIPNPNNLPQVNHIDGNKVNNHVSNLEWCTASENLLHAYNNGLRSKNDLAKKKQKLNLEQVKEIRSLYVRGKHSTNNSYGLAKKYNVCPKTIQNIVNNKTYSEALFKEVDNE